MELATVLELIGSVGFPIAAVVVLGWFIFKIYNQSVQREAALMTELAENRKTNEKAIETLTLYAERLTHIEVDVAEIKEDIGAISEKIG